MAAENKNRRPQGGPPGGGHAHGFRKPKDAKKTIIRLLNYLTHKKWILLLVALLVAVSSGAQVAGTYFLKPLINDYITPLIGANPTAADFLPLAKQLLILMGIYLSGVFASYIYSRLMINVAQSTLNSIRKDLFEHMQDLSLKFFDTHPHGELMSRFTSDTDTIREAISQGLVQLISSGITASATFIMMLVLSPILTIIVLLVFVLMIVSIKIIGGKSAKFFRQQQKAVGIANGFIEESIEGQKVIKVFSREKIASGKFSEFNENLRHAATNANTYANIIMPVMGNLSYLHYALTACVGAVMVIKSGIMDVGSLASFLQYTRQFGMPITMLSQQINSILSALAGAERIFEVLDEQPEIDDGVVTLVFANKTSDGTIIESNEYTGIWAWKYPHEDGTVTYTQLKGDVRLHNVTFSYDDKKTVLKDVSLYAKPGQKIAFVGSTGAGKTTITNLINRFYEVQEGKITYDGIDLKEIRKNDLRRSLAMVLQDTHLFTGTVAENIRYGNLHATQDEVIQAAKLANAHSFISRLPKGYDTLLSSDGTNLSQGQRQLLAIARAAVANPPVLVLDEATSSIDTRTEALIEKGMDKLMEGRTVFVIAHRLSTVRNSNAIMVLENGEIIERGDHDGLLKQEGKYYQLYTGQYELS